jgi:hypothetical protein
MPHLNEIPSFVAVMKSFNNKCGKVACYNSPWIKLLILLHPVAPTWSTGHPLNASFHFSSLIGRTPWMGDQAVKRPLPNTNTEWTQTYIHALSEIRTHNLRVSASGDISYLRPRGHCDRWNENSIIEITTFSWILVEKLTVAQLPIVCGNQRSITALTRASHWSRWFQLTPSSCTLQQVVQHIQYMLDNVYNTQ